MRTSPFLRNAEASLSAQSSKCYTFERKNRNWTLKRTRFARNFLFKFKYTLIMLYHIMYFFFHTSIFVYWYLYVKIFFHIPLLIMMTWSHRNVKLLFYRWFSCWNVFQNLSLLFDWLYDNLTDMRKKDVWQWLTTVETSAARMRVPRI